MLISKPMQKALNSMEEHIPVLLQECIEGLSIKPDGTYVDLTLGRAGHSSEILKRLTTGHLIGVDQDKDAIEKSTKRLEAISSNFEVVESNFVNIKKVLEERNIEYVDGVLMDLGVSSPQFDDGSRGFSYRSDAPLDMRMDQVHNTLTAKEVVNTYSFEKLCKVFREYGDERFADRIADNIIKTRKQKPIETTFELVEIIKRSKPDKELKKAGHPAKQVFQALRIEVNDELNVLTKTLNDIIPFLRKSGGRLCVISFHSGEDKIVKKIFANYAKEEGNRFDFKLKEEEKEYREVNRKVILASEEELELNHRSQSAKLRILERK